MAGKLQTFVDLQTTLRNLAAADGRFHSIPEWMSELHEEHCSKRAEIDAAEEAGEAAATQRRAAETALSDAQEQLKRYQEQLSRVTTQREYGALLKEIDSTKELIRTSEQEALDAGELQEESEKAAKELREAFQDLDERYSAELAKWEGEKPTVAATIEDLKAKSEQLRSEVPRNLLQFFDRLYDRSGGDALARVRKAQASRGANTVWHCEACSYTVRPQVVVEIRNRGSLNQCESCKRILYLEYVAANEA